MPIQFRCGSCQQLLGIAKRKAGAIVDCPTCRQKTRVPIVKENVAPPPPSKELTNKPVSIFDRVDVEKLLSPPLRKESEKSKKAVSLAESLGPLVPDDTPPDPLAGIHENSSARKKEAEPINDDEPFTLTSATTLPSPKVAAKWKFIALLGGAALLVAAAAFFAGHWVGTH
jgi:hypothetical protein